MGAAPFVHPMAEARSPQMLGSRFENNLILVTDIDGYSRLAGTDEDRILARMRTLRSDLIDPSIAVHNGRIVRRTGDGSIVEFSSVVDACAARSKCRTR
jgi:class 3 adenylate cyclase